VFSSKDPGGLSIPQKIESGLVMVPGQKFLTLVWSIFCYFGSGLGLEIKFPLKIPNFPIFLPLVQKNYFGKGQKVTGLPLF